MKSFLKDKVLLLLICALTLLLYLPTLSYYPEGDDFLFLWHIRVPISFLQIPFYGWEESIAGRFGYGQAWYGAAVSRIFGPQLLVYNLFGIFSKILALLAVYIFAKRLTDNKFIPLVSAFMFAVLSTGVNGEINLFLHFSLIFLAIFLYATSLFVKGLEEKNFIKIVTGSALILLGNYLYVIRGFGVVLLPFLVFLRNIPIRSTPKMLYSVSLATLIVLLSAAMVVKFIPGASFYTSQTLIENSLDILKSIQLGHYGYLRSVLLSVGYLYFSPEFYSFLNQLLGAGHNITSYLQFWSPVIWTFLYLLFVYPLYISKKISQLDLFGWYSIGIFWNLLILLLYNQGITLFIGGEVVIITIGIEIVLLSLIMGLFYLKIAPKVGSTLIATTVAAIFFYIPNWLHDPVIVSQTESRYLTVSSGFIAISLSIMSYILFSQIPKLKMIHSNILASFFFIISILIFFFIFLTHLKYLNNIISINKSFRNIDIISSHWNFVRSRVDFTKRPLVVVVSSGADIDSARREFFRHQSLGLIGNIPWDYQLTDKVRLYYSMEDSARAICDWEKNNVVFNPTHFYEFKLTADRQIVDKSEGGRQKLSSWRNYCLDPSKKGLEVNN